MIETFLNLHPGLQIFLLLATVIGLIVMYRFRNIIAVIAAAAIAIFLGFKNKNKQQ